MKPRWISLALLCAGMALPAFGQGPNDKTSIQFQQGGSNVMFGTGYFKFNFASGCTAVNVSNTLTVSCTGGAGNPGGSANQIQFNLGGSAFSGFTMSQDCTLVVGTGAITCTKTNNVAFGPFATQTSPCTVAEGCTGTTSTLSGIVRGGSPMTASEISGDATTSGSNALTLATVNSAVGSFTCANITVNAKGLITASANGVCPTAGTVGQVLTTNNLGNPVFTSNLIDNSQSGGTGVTLVGPVTFSGSAFQWYGTTTPGSALTCGANAEGFGADLNSNPSWCNSTGTGALYWSGNFGVSATSPLFGTGGGSALNATATLTPAITSLASPFLLAFLPSYSAPGGGSQMLSVNGTTQHSLFKQGTTSISAGDFNVTEYAFVFWDPTNGYYELINPLTGGSGGSGSVTSIVFSPPLTGGTIMSTGTVGCPTCVTSAASLTSTAIMTGAGSQGSQTPSSTATLSAGGNVSFPGTLSADGIAYPTSLTSGGVLYGSSSSALASSGTLANGQFVLGGGAGGAPTTSFSVVPNTNGGTGQNSSAANGVAQVLSGTWSFSTALANFTTATTQSLADNTTKVATDAFVLANAITNPCSSAALGSLIYQGASNPACLAAPTSPTGVPNIVSTIPGSAPTYGPAGVPIDTQSASSYSLAITDRAENVLTTNSTTATGLTVPSPTSTGYGQGFPFIWINAGSVVGTATTTSSNVNANATLKMVGAVSGHNPEASGWYNDGANWWAWTSMPSDANGRLGCEVFPALSTDLSNTAGLCSVTVVGVNGASVPASAKVLGSNSSSQEIAAALTSTHLYVGNGSNLPADVAASLDVSLANTGAFTVVGVEGAAIPASAFFIGSNGSSQLIANQPFVINSQTATYNTVAADWAGCKTISIASGTFTLSLLATPPASGQCINVSNYGSGTITIGRNGNTINGAAANITIAGGTSSAPLGAAIWSAGGTAYIAQPYGGGGSGGAVSSVSNSDGTLTISPTTGSVVASLNLSHANTWAAIQTITNSDLALLGSSTGATTFTSANSSATNYTATFPANTGTLAELNLAQTWTAAQALGSSTATTQSQLDGSNKLATTLYTDTAVSNAVAGVNPAVAVLAASTANLTGTYVQVGGGVGDTFTITATGAFTLDGIAINTIGQRVLLKNQTTASQNGVYTATVVGTTGVSAVFTRALDYDTPSDVNNTGTIPVQSGTVNTTTSWLLTSQVTSIGSSGSSLTYAQFSYNPTNVALLSGSAFTGAVTSSSTIIASGIVDGKAPVTITTGTTATLGAGTYSSGYTFNQEATAATAVTYTLPATAVGLQYCVRNSIVSGTGAADTGVITVYPPASSYVILNGVRNTIGGGGTHGVASGGAAADSACFVAIDATDWEVYVQRGNWTAN